MMMFKYRPQNNKLKQRKNGKEKPVEFNQQILTENEKNVFLTRNYVLLEFIFKN